MGDYTYSKTHFIVLHSRSLGNKLEGEVKDIVSLKAQTSPYFELREKFKCIEHIDNSETQLKTSL